MLTDDGARAQLIAEAREYVLQFDWAGVARRTEGVYAALAKAGLRATTRSGRASPS